jgi:hypothetical protein
MEAIRPRYRGGLGGWESVARAVRLIRWFLSAATTFLSSGGVKQLKAGVGRRFDPRSATRGPVGLPSMWVQGVSRAPVIPLGLWALEGPLCGQEGVGGGFEPSSPACQRLERLLCGLGEGCSTFA